MHPTRNVQASSLEGIWYYLEGLIVFVYFFRCISRRIQVVYAISVCRFPDRLRSSLWSFDNPCSEADGDVYYWIFPYISYEAFKTYYPVFY